MVLMENDFLVSVGQTQTDFRFSANAH